MELTVNYYRGVNNAVFGMSPGDVSELMGKPEKFTSITDIDDKEINRTEIRNQVKFIYENEQLVCICGELGVPFYFGEDKIPFTFTESLRFLKNKSKLNKQFSQSASYVFDDIGIVMYPCKTVDLDAGIQTTTTKHCIAICNIKVLERYRKRFAAQEKTSNHDIGSYLISNLGAFAEDLD